MLNSAWWINNRPRPPTSETSSSNFFYTNIRFDGTAPPPSNFITRITTHPVWLALCADIFTGQIIVSLIVLIFVAVFLVREWIAQNARPGVPEPEPQPQPQAIDADDFPELHGAVQRQADAMQAVNVIQRQNFDPDVALNPDRWFQDDDEGPGKNVKKQKTRKVDDNDGDRWQVDQRRKSHNNHGQHVEDFRRKQFHWRIHVAKAVGAHRRDFYRPQKPHFPPPHRNVLVAAEGQQKFDFTFKSDQSRESSSKPQVPSSSHTSNPPTNSNKSFAFISANDISPFPTVALQPPSSEIPFSLRSLQPETSISPQSYPARPTLPTYTLGGSRSGSESPFPCSPVKTSVESPSQATYRAPEELGPRFAVPSSSPPDYFELERIEQEVEDEAVYGGHPDDDDAWDNVDPDENMNLEEEHNKYFREHGNVATEVERGRYLREVARDEDREVPQQERVRIQVGVESGSEDETDEDEGEEEIHDDCDHEDEEENLQDEEEDDGQWQEEDEDQVMPDGQAGQGAQVAGEPGPADGLDEEDPGANLNHDLAENVMDEAMEGMCKFSQDRPLTNTTLLAIGMRGPIYVVFQNVCSIISS